MIRFESDYTEGACPEIMERLLKTNYEQTCGYGEDEYCAAARERIKSAIGSNTAVVHFLVGGTQANATLIASALRPHQCVVCAETGHINVHESGAVEATGHKVVSLPGKDGKITAAQIEDVLKAHYTDSSREHTVQPGLVYISNPTESGTLYTKSELAAISGVCRANSVLLYTDGARMGYGLASPANDLTLFDYARLCDAFTIGGTKVGALFGEALVLTNERINRDFRYIMKQRGGMLAKGRLLGLQFDTLFTDDLYLKISRHAIEQAICIKTAFESAGVSFLYESPTNQIFPILNNEALSRLGEKYSFCFWQHVDEAKSAVRFCTSWATKESDTEELCRDIKAVLK